MTADLDRRGFHRRSLGQRLVDATLTGVAFLLLCRCSPTGYLLATGSVPECVPNADCPHSISGVHADEEPRNGGRCIYCKTVYPATAEVEAVSP